MMVYAAMAVMAKVKPRWVLLELGLELGLELELRLMLVLVAVDSTASRQVSVHLRYLCAPAAAARIWAALLPAACQSLVQDALLPGLGGRATVLGLELARIGAAAGGAAAAAAAAAHPLPSHWPPGERLLSSRNRQSLRRHRCEAYPAARAANQCLSGECAQEY